MFAGLSLPDIEVDNNYIYVLFRYFPLLRVYSLDGKLLLQADITKPNQTELIKGNLNQRNFVKKQNYTFNFVNRGLFVVADRLFITKQERFVVIDEYKLTSDSLIYVTTFTYDGNLTDDYFVIDFFYREKSNSFFLLEKNDDFKVTEYEVIK